MRPCIVCGAVTERTRCKRCAAVKDAARRSTGKGKAYDSSEYRRTREAMRGDVCHLCGLPGADSVDHVVPLALGGSNARQNLRPAHLACNLRKGAQRA